MSDTKVFSLLHVSDFHFSKRKAREQVIVVDALVKDLETICIGHRRPDIVLFTGDLVNAAGVESHFEAHDFFIDRLAKATGCSDERIFIVPGNHDAARSVVDTQADAHREWQTKSNDMAAMNSLFDDGTFESLRRSKFDHFHDLEQLLSDASPIFSNAFVTIHRVEPLNTDVVIFNTALLTTTGQHGFEPDSGRLAVAEYAVLDAMKALTPNSFRIFATHHPLHWLSETSAKFLRGIIQQNAAMHLFGHMHEPLTLHASSYEGELYSDQAGAIFAGRERYIGYSLISVEPTKHLFETHLRSFYKDRREFDAAIDVLPDGKFYSSQEARQFWRGIAAPVDDKAFRDHLVDDCLPTLLVDPEQASIGEKKMHEIFVPAPMKRNHFQQRKQDEPEITVEETVAFDELVIGSSHVILYASPEYGRTTVLREVQYRLLQEARDLSFARLPVIIDFVDIKHNAGNMFRMVRSRVVSLGNGFDFESLLKLGHVAILIDDVVFEDSRRMGILREFVRQYPKARYFFTSLKASVAPYGASIDPEMPIQFDLVELCAYRRRDMRQLVSKWNGLTDIDGVLDRIQAEIGEINLPFTAANGTILMVILEEQSGFRPVNRWVLIEQFVEVTLKKGSMEQSKRETFDYHNKTALLAHIAGWMARNNSYVVEVEAVRDVMKSYVEHIEVTVNLNSLMDELLAARLFVTKAENRIGFRYRAVLEYFIALNMKRDRAFMDWVLDESRYLSFINEIQYFAGAVRDDGELVDEIGRRFAALMGAVAADVGGIDLNRITTLELPVKDSENRSVDHLAQQLSDAPLSEEERDAELESEVPRDAEERQEVFRPVVENLGHKFLTSLLLYSGLIKNMEEIAGSDKRRHLASVWRGWGAFLHMSLQLVPELARDRKIRINGVLYELGVPLGMSDEELARRISLGMPIGLSRLLSASLGTEKLEQQLTEPELAEQDEPLVVDFFRTSLIADLKLVSVVTAIKNTLHRLRTSPYLSEAMVQKIAELRRYERISEERFASIAPSVAETIARLGGATGKALGDAKRKQIARLQRQGVMLRLRKQTEKER